MNSTNRSDEQIRADLALCAKPMRAHDSVFTRYDAKARIVADVPTLLAQRDVLRNKLVDIEELAESLELSASINSLWVVAEHQRLTAQKIRTVLGKF